MNSPTLILLLRLIHILSAIFWVGGIMIVAGFLLPTVRALGPGAGPMMTELMQVRKLPLRILIAGWTTVLSGFVLYWRAASLGGSAWSASSSGRVFGVGGAIALATILMGTFGNAPTAKRMGALTAQIQAAGGAPSPELAAELQRLQARLGLLTRIAVVLLVIVASAMAVARYWP